MRTPFVIVSLFLAAAIFLIDPITANCGNGVSNSDEAKCRKDNAPDLVQKNHNKGSSSDEDSDSGEGDSGSDSGSDADGDGNSDSDSGNSGDLEDDWDSIENEDGALNNETTGSPATGATRRYRHNRFHCDLTDALRNISVVLDVEQKVRFEVCVRRIENFLAHSFGLTEVKKAAIVAHKLRKCLKKHGDIRKRIAFEKITTWGSVFDITYVTIDLQADFADAIINLDANDNCDLFDTLRNATEGDLEKQSAVIVLIEELKIVLLDMSLSQGQKKAKIHGVLKAFLKANVEWEEFFLDIEIEGFGPFESFLDVTHGFKRSLTLSVVLSGSSDADCSLCSALSEAVANTSFSLSVRNQIKQFHDKLIAFFATTIDVEVRLAYVSQQYWQMIIMEPFIVEVMSLISIEDSSEAGEEWGIFYDLIWTSQFCKNSGSCGCLSCGLGTTPVSTSTSMPTTTIAPAVCPNRPTLIVISAENKTILTDVLTENYNSWNASTKLGFNTCFNQVRTAIWNNVAFPTPAAKITEIVLRFKQYNANNLPKQQVLMDIFIAKWNGKIKQFCDCGSG